MHIDEHRWKPKANHVPVDFCNSPVYFFGRKTDSFVVSRLTNLEPGPSALRWLLGDDAAETYPQRCLQATILVRMGLVRSYPFDQRASRMVFDVFFVFIERNQRKDDRLLRYHVRSQAFPSVIFHDEGVNKSGVMM